MYQGKHHKRSRRRSGKSIALLVSLLLILGITVGGIIAFLMDQTDPLHNLFDPSQVTTKVEETLSDTTKSDVYIKNTGDTDAWIRAAVVITWQDKDGNVYGQKPAAGTDYTITWGDGWLTDTNGFYYWPDPVAADGGKTGILIKSCTTEKTVTVGETTYYLTVEIIGSGIQSKPDTTVMKVWPVVIDNGKLELNQG